MLLIGSNVAGTTADLSALGSSRALGPRSPRRTETRGQVRSGWTRRPMTSAFWRRRGGASQLRRRERLDDRHGPKHQRDRHGKCRGRRRKRDGQRRRSAGGEPAHHDGGRGWRHANVGSGVTLNAGLTLGAGQIVLNGGVAADTVINSLRHEWRSRDHRQSRCHRSGQLGGQERPAFDGRPTGQRHRRRRRVDRPQRLEYRRGQLEWALSITGRDLFATDTVETDAIRLEGPVSAAGTMTLSTGSGAPLEAGAFLNATVRTTAGDVLVNSFGDPDRRLEHRQCGRRVGDLCQHRGCRSGDERSDAASQCQRRNDLRCGRWKHPGFGESDNRQRRQRLPNESTLLQNGTINATIVSFQDDVRLGADTTITGTTVTFGKTINDGTATRIPCW